MIILTVLGASPLNVFAQETETQTTTEITFNGETIEMNEDDSFSIGSKLNMIEPPETTVTITQEYIELPEPVITTVPIALALARNNIGSSEDRLETLLNTFRPPVDQDDEEQQASIVIDTAKANPNEDGTYTVEILASENVELVGTEIVIPSETLMGLSLNVNTSYTYEEYMELREFYYGHRSLTEPVDRMAQLRARVAGNNVGRPNHSNDETWGRTVIQDGRPLSPLRYSITLEGVEFELFCLQPSLAGAENANAPTWEVVEKITDQKIINSLRYGYPTNTALTNSAYDAYLTRIAVAQAGPESGNLTGDQELITDAIALIAGNPSYQGHTRGRVTINGTENATGDNTTVFTTSGSATRSCITIANAPEKHGRQIFNSVVLD